MFLLFVVVGTIWQNLPDLQRGAEKLVEEATKRWMKESKGRYCDDITCVVVAFNAPK
jgi:serine/threonine protein phosphatase PrpC